MPNHLRKFISKAGQRDQAIAKSFIWIAAFALIGKIAGAIKEVAIAWRYGVSDTVDAYVFLVNFLTWPVAVWFSVLTIVLVPLIAQMRRSNASESPRFLSELLGFTVLLGLALAAVAWWGVPMLLLAGWTGFTRSAMNQAQAMSGPLTAVLPLGMVISLFSAWTMACGRHRNTLLEALPASIIVVTLMLPTGWLSEPLMWGTIAGFLLQAVILGVYLRHMGELRSPLLSRQNPAWKHFWTGFGIMLAGQLLSSTTSLIDQFFAAHLEPGSVSTLSYASRLLALVFGLGAMAISRATLPVFSEAKAQGETNVDQLALRWAKRLFVVGIVVAAIGMVFAPLAIKILFERGAFTAEDTAAVAKILRYSLLQVPFYFFGLVMVSLLAANQRYALIALSGAVNLLTKIVFTYLLIGEHQLMGLVSATAAMYAVSGIFLYLAVRWSSQPTRQLERS